MGVRIRVEVGRDGGALRDVGLCILRQDAHHGLAVGAHMLAQGSRHIRQGAIAVARCEQNIQRPQHPGRQHHPACTDRRQAHAALPWVAQVQPVALSRQFLQMGDLAFHPNRHSGLLSQVKVVLVQRVFGAHRTAGDAAATTLAPLARRPLPRKKGIGMCAARCTKENALWHRPEAGLRPHPAGRFAQPFILQSWVGIGGQTQHALCGGVMRRQLGLPAALGVGPGGVGEKRFLRTQQHGRIDQAATAQPNATHDAHMLKDLLRQRSATAQAGHPGQGAGIGSSAFQFFGRQAAPLLQQGHLPALFCQTQGADAATEAGAHHHHIVVEVIRRTRHAWRSNRKGKACPRNPGRSITVMPSRWLASSVRSSSRTQRQGRGAWAP